MAINDLLEIGKQGMAANRQALQTTSNNIANANTPGYSRQRAVFSPNQQSSMQGIRLGGGVEIKQVVRSHDVFVQNQILEESRQLGGLKAKSESLKRVESALHNENFQIGNLVNKFFDDVRTLSASPEIPALRENVAAAANNAATGFRNLHGSLQSLKADIDTQLEFGVHEINNLTRELAGLNSKIFELESTGNMPNELHDRRDQVVRDLSQRLGLQSSTDDHGNINLNAGGLGILVLGGDHRELAAERTPENGKKGAGSLDIFVKDPGGNRLISGAITDGELGGLLHVRDQVLNNAIQHLDATAFQFANSVNEVHREGVGLDGGSGRDLFSVSEAPRDAARVIALGETIMAHKEAVAAGLDSDAAGDNRVALMISELQEARLMPLSFKEVGAVLEEGAEPVVGSHNFSDSLNSLVSRVAVETQTEEQNLHHQESIMTQLENYRQSIAGVSLEEEAINMMQYQAVFNASAKAMRVGDELLQTILSLKD